MTKDFDEAGGEPLPFTAYVLDQNSPVPRIVPSPVRRGWMNSTRDSFAQRCLPLLMANQAGWVLLNPSPFRVTWNGGDALSALSIEPLDGGGARPIVASIFGYGILTWTVNYLFRTPPGYNLWVRGPANLPKDGIAPLEGLVETDWAVASFTMNWKMTRPDHAVTFEADEPFCMVSPLPRHELERFDPRIVPIQEEPELEAEWKTFHRQRAMMAQLHRLTHQKSGPGTPTKVPFERHYLEGKTPSGKAAPEHQRKLSLKPFMLAADSSDPASTGRESGDV